MYSANAETQAVQFTRQAHILALESADSSLVTSKFVFLRSLSRYSPAEADPFAVTGPISLSALLM
jgi:hypothetical protein